MFTLAPACADAPVDDDDDVAEGESEGEGEGDEAIELANCDTPIVSGIALDEGIVDGDPRFADAFANADYSVLGDTVTFDDGFTTSAVAWGLNIPVDGLSGPVRVDDLRALGIMGDVVAAAFTFTPGELDFTFFRQGLQRYAACDRQWPLTLDGFKAVYGDPVADNEAAIIDSFPKRPHQRRLWQKPDAGLWLAETFENGVVKETEIVMSGRRNDGALDFIVYDDEGKLSNASRFGTNGATTLHLAAPYACLACHADDSFGFTVVSPDMR